MSAETQTILYIDDESMLCEIAQEMLEMLGYRVVTATSSIEAYDLFAADPDQFALVITDMSMPRLTGDKLAQKMLALRPGTPVIICTGYSDPVFREDVARLGIRECLMKPYDISQLTRTVHRIIGAAAAGSTPPADGTIA